MDESEKLIAKAALSQPNRALEAWNEWKASNPLSLASPILIWAGGYVSENLKKSGIEDPYLKGIFRHNLISNNIRLRAAHPTLSAINKKYGLIPLKSFSLSTKNFTWGNRPVADFDFYSDATFAPSLWDQMVSEDLTPLMHVSKRFFLEQIMSQRGSWNFRDFKLVDVDFHWKIFDHLSLSENRKLISSNLSFQENSNGFNKTLNSELELLLLMNHTFLQGENRFNGLFDIYNHIDQVNENKFIELVKESNTEESLFGTVKLFEEVLEIEDIEKFHKLVENYGKNKRKLASTPLLRNNRYFYSSNTTYSYSIKRGRRLIYWLWSVLGRHASLEKFIIRISGPMTKFCQMNLGESIISKNESIGLGWHYRYPEQNFLWAHVPDSRLSVKLKKNANLTLKIVLDESMWSIAPVNQLNIFVNGHFLGSCDKSMNIYSFNFESKLNFAEVSFRPLLCIDFKGSVNFNWNRMAAPIKELSINYT